VLHDLKISRIDYSWLLAIQRLDTRPARADRADTRVVRRVRHT